MFLLTVGPAVPPVDLRQAADNLGIDGGDSDSRIEGWLRGIVSNLEKRIQQCLIRQEWQAVLPCFPPSIALPHPVLDVVSVSYIDEAGAERELPSSAVRLVRGQYTTLLKPARGQAWPATLQDDEAVRVVVHCGYGDTPADVPDDLKLYILAKLVEQFDPATGTERETPRTSYIDNLLDQYRSYE